MNTPLASYFINTLLLPKYYESKVALVLWPSNCCHLLHITATKYFHLLKGIHLLKSKFSSLSKICCSAVSCSWSLTSKPCLALRWKKMKYHSYCQCSYGLQISSTEANYLSMQGANKYCFMCIGCDSECRWVKDEQNYRKCTVLWLLVYFFCQCVALSSYSRYWIYIYIYIYILHVSS
jgi:hypothetical protein